MATETPVIAPSRRSDADLLADRVKTVLDGRWGWIRDLVRDELRHPLMAPVVGLDTESHRARTLEQVRYLGTTAGPPLLFPSEHGGGDDLGGAITSFETLAMGDLSLLVKAGVQFGLFGGAITNLGNADHRARYLPDVMSVELPGCFAMTETGHGSDVQAIRTTATFDPETDELVVHTPDDDARKDYIGNAARDGRMAVVFCQLIVPAGPQGVHAVLVPIRDAANRARPRVRIEDCGHKGGLNGVDNGRLSFDHVRVPRTNLLDRYGQVAADGTYTSPIENEGRRFFTTLGTLVQGRISVSGAALSATKVALTIATRYALVRRQFRAPHDPDATRERDDPDATRARDDPDATRARDDAREIVLLDYRQHQRRLLPAIATTYALHAAQEALVADLDASFAEPARDVEAELADRVEAELAGRVEAELAGRVEAGMRDGEGSGRPQGGAEIPDRRELEALAAGIKTATTWHATATIQMCREACGGAGYLSENRLVDLKADTDVFTTFEGDNTVLLQLVAKGLLTGFASEFGSLDTFGMVRFVTDQVLETVVEKTSARRLLRTLQAAVPGRDEDADLHDRAWQRELFAWREEHVISGVARRIQRAVKGGADGFDAFNDAQDHVLLAAQAHIDRVVLERFAALVERTEDTDVAALLDRLCDLYALHTIEAERGWFLEHGRLSAARTKAITAAINDLCGQLRPHAGSLVEAFGVPDEVVLAPIALGEEAARQDAKADEVPYG